MSVRAGDFGVDGRVRFVHVQLHHELACDRIVETAVDENPNVLIEYGWALNALGHSRILPVMNTVG